MERRQPLPLTAAADHAFYGRDLACVICAYYVFKRCGAPSHQQRTILLDTVIRSCISQPCVEFYEDGTLRYDISAAPIHARQLVDDVRALRPYVRQNGNMPWMYLLSPLCAHCLCPWNQHAQPSGKCLFEATYWRDLLIPDPNSIRRGPL